MVEGLATPCDKWGGEVAGVEEALTSTLPYGKVSRASPVEFAGGGAGKRREGDLLERGTHGCKEGRSR